MRTWKALWFSVTIQWVGGVVGISIVEYLTRLAGGEREDPTPFMLFFLLLVFVNAVGKDLHNRIEDLRQRSERFEQTLDELERGGQGG